MEKVYLIDASPIFYKAFFAVPPLNSKNGVPTNAAFGFTRTLLTILKKYDPKYVGVCFDNHSKHRKELYEDYKIDRKPMAQNLYKQLPIIKKVTESLGLTVLDVDGYEADDLIGMVAKLAEREGKEVVIISPDKDLCQLVNEKIQILVDLKKNEIYNEEKVKEKFGVRPDQIADYLALAGDAVDGIPGVLGIGKGTAVKLINEHNHIEDLYKNIESVKGANKQKLIDGQLSCELSKQLATIITENSSGIERIEQLERVYVDKPQLTSLFDALNFLSLKDKISDLE